MPRPIIFFILFFFTSAIAAQTPAEMSEFHGRVRRSLDERNYASVVSQLRDLESRNASVFKANNYDYLLGRMSEEIGDTATAMASFQGVVGRNSVLKEYALWHLSRLSRASGNLVLERIHLQELISFSPGSLLQAAARRRLAESWFDSGNFDLAIRQAESRSQAPGSLANENSSKTAAFRRELAFLAEAYLRAGNTPKARELFLSLTSGLPNPAQPDDFALAGVLGLDLTEPENATLSDYEHLKRATVYQFNRDFDHARSHFAAIIDRHPSSGLVPDAILQTGRGYAQQGDYTEALKWFERLLESSPDHPVSQETLLQAASAYARVGKYREAVTRYKKYIELYPDGERLDRAYLNVIDVLRDQREEIEAMKWAATVREKFRGKTPEALAMFAEARIYLARSDWENALASLDTLQTMLDLGGANAPGGTNIAEVRFLRAFALEQLRRYAEAIDTYLSIPDGRNEYYGGRATERLRSMLQNENAKAFVVAKAASLDATKPTDPDAARKQIQARLRLTVADEDRSRLLDTLRTAYAATPAYASAPKFMFINRGRQAPVMKEASASATASPRAIADELLFLGLYDEAAPEAEVSGATVAKDANRRGEPTKADLDYTNAVLHTRGDMAYRGAAFIESVWKMPADYHPELIPDEVLELLYPTPYATALIAHAPRKSVDPRFLLSIMRQESRFRPDVKSYAAARGLMQFISTTAKRVAAELEREDFRQDDLYDPATAVLFGSHYTGNLFTLFPGQPPAVAASYNGGEDNMQRWLSRSKSDQPDRYVPEIVFAQSKDYVYRVMANYRMYQMLYDENLKKK